MHTAGEVAHLLHRPLGLLVGIGEKAHGASSGPQDVASFDVTDAADTNARLGRLGLPRFDGQGWWLGQATVWMTSWSVAVSNWSGVR